jgi:hypothetical protein
LTKTFTGETHRIQVKLDENTAQYQVWAIPARMSKSASFKRSGTILYYGPSKKKANSILDYFVPKAKF